MNVILGVMLGASLGAMLRWWLSVKFNHVSDHLFIGTLLANVLACFLMGYFLGYEQSGTMINGAVKLAFLTGFLGSLSTFSTFILEVYGHIAMKEWIKLILGFNLQIVLGLLSFHFAKVLAGSYH